MVLETTLISLAIFVLFIASYADLRSREVPDWLNYGFIFAVLGIRSIFSLQQGWVILVEGLLGLAIFFLLACLFYYAGLWGGGDSKLLMGMGAVLGVSLPFSAASFVMFYFLLSLLFLGSVWGLIYMIIIAVKKKGLFAKEFSARFNKRKKTNHAILFRGVIFLLLGALISSFFFLAIFLPAVYFLLIFVSIVEKSCFIRNCKIENLTEGDWLNEDVFVGNRKIIEKKTLQKGDLHMLVMLKKEKKIDHVKVKDGIPFVPSFLFAYLTVILADGNFVFFLRRLLGF